MIPTNVIILTETNYLAYTPQVEWLRISKPSTSSRIIKPLNVQYYKFSNDLSNRLIIIMDPFPKQKMFD